MDTDTRLRPFSCSTQMEAWIERNCARCALCNPECYEGKCDLDLAIFEALAGDGSVSAEMAARMGYSEMANVFTWDCPERQ